MIIYDNISEKDLKLFMKIYAQNYLRTDEQTKTWFGTSQNFAFKSL